LARLRPDPAAEALHPLTTSVILGLIWTAWHAPRFFVPGSSQQGLEIGWYPAAIGGMSITLTPGVRAVGRQRVARDRLPRWHQCDQRLDAGVRRHRRRDRAVGLRRVGDDQHPDRARRAARRSTVVLPPTGGEQPAVRAGSIRSGNGPRYRSSGRRLSARGTAVSGQATSPSTSAFHSRLTARHASSVRWRRQYGEHDSPARSRPRSASR